MKAYCDEDLQIFRTSETGNNGNFTSTMLINNNGKIILVPTSNNNMVEVKYERKFNIYSYQSISENFELIFHKKSGIHPITSGKIDCIYSIEDNHIEEIKFEKVREDFTFEKFFDNSIYFILSNFSTRETIPHKKLLNLRKAIYGH